MKQNFRRLLRQKSATLMPVVHDALTAKIAEQVGFKAIAVGGFASSAVLYGLPDLSFIGLADIVAVTRNIASTVSIPVLVDADSGYGNEANVTRTTSLLENAGAAAIFIEDQEWPKKCGHLDGKKLVSAEEMASKIRAAVQARQDQDFVICARTDAIAVEGFKNAISRAHAYSDAGADLIFIEAPRDKQELAAIPRQITEVPLLVNMLDGGRTPITPKAELERMGYKIIAYPITTLLACAKASELVLRELLREGSTQSIAGELCPLERFKKIIGLDDWLAKHA